MPLPATRKKSKKHKKDSLYLICLSTHVLLSEVKTFLFLLGPFFAKKAIKICRSGKKRKEENLIQALLLSLRSLFCCRRF